MPFYKNRKRMLKHRAIKRAVAGKRYNKRHLNMRVSDAVKTYVKRTIHSQIENKCVQINPGQLAFGNVLESPDFNAYPLAPLNSFWTIAQGVGQGNRVGNIIKVRKVMLNYILRPAPYDVLTNPNTQPSEVRLMLGYVKNSPAFLPLNTDIAQLFNVGSTSQAPVGTLKDLISPYNNDYWTIKKSWTHKLGFANNSGTGGSPGVQYHANNDFKYNAMARIDVTRYMPKTCVFNDAVGTTNTKNLFFMYYAVAAGGGTYGATTLPVFIDYWIDFHYEDA